VTQPAPAHPAATVVLLRDAGTGPEVLLLRRSSRLDFHGGAWVFPGGRIDADDLVRAEGVAAEAARLAAVREVQEEASLQVDPAELVAVSRWVTPVVRPKRFDTYFYAAALESVAEVQVDGGEICDHRWVAPRAALDARAAGEIELPPPTFVTLVGLMAYESIAETLTSLAQQPTEEYRPRVHRVPDGLCSLYQGDAGYDSGEVELPGSRHRLWMLASGWRYQRESS